MSKPVRLTLLLLAGAMVTPAAAQDVDTLSEALSLTYETNPTLTGERAALRGDDAGVALARSGARPSLSAVAGINRDLTRSGILESTQPKGPDLSVGVDLSLPLFRGGQVKNGIRAAKARVAAGRATLRAVEGDIFVQAVAAYMDVRLNRDIVELNQNQVRVLDTNLQATSDRFEIGDVTRTDVAQSQARLQLAQANLASAEGRLASAIETFREVIGVFPGDLAPPPPLPPLPQTAEEAVDIALAYNADFEAIVANAAAARFDTKAAKGARLPTLSAVGSGTYLNALGSNPSAIPNSGTSTSVGVSSRIPIYQGGAPSARIRQAQAFESQLLERRVAVERAVIADARSAFATYEAAQRAIAANQVAVEANELAQEGARLEQSIGSRDVLDVLNAEQELLNSQVSLATAERDAYVAGFRLLDVMGQAEAEDLNLEGTALYDPLGNYRRVAGDIMDWAGDPDPEPVATPTR
ncbi:TolC family outer membrane protein [Sphingomicrobium clamense]|uniref:TolC family outer membrane protein n=1 Tax=Sphingomicrobium clamense TaxID=2851013 RepID=A0ABS6V902_9SPHN|nr:TolC family outer membrane protein [Sphingomicrobium sp. B8]MBW0145553.1 TolC family outer membrane protein [Sphingomicrobium sp. B8]